MGQLSALCAIAGMSLDRHPLPHQPPSPLGQVLVERNRNPAHNREGDLLTYSHRTTVQIIELGFGRETGQLNKYQSSHSFIYSFSRYLRRALVPWATF